MTDELKFPGPNGRPDRDSLSEPLVALIRDAYAPPGGNEYWSGLEQRIMARVASEGAGDGRWWNVLAPWARTGLVAAAAIFALAGVINQQLVDSDSQLAYDSVIQDATPDVVSTSEELLSLQRGTDGATLNYFLSH
ncbi:MAG: hypothetical protein ABI681_06425 [Gemmatimonadales bacterium]